VPAEKPPNRYPAGGDLALLQRGAELVQCQVWLLARQAEQYRLVISQRRITAAARLGRDLTTCPPALHQRIAELTLTLNCAAAA
jgi:hypothetical protein